MIQKKNIIQKNSSVNLLSNDSSLIFETVSKTLNEAKIIFFAPRIRGTIDELQGDGAGGAKFRDPVMEGASTKHVTSASANDANFDTYISVQIVETNDGNIVQTENWGLLNLSYIIKKNKKANYIHFKIKGSGKIIKELEKNESIDQNLLRYMTVKVKKFDLQANYFTKNGEKEKENNKN